jgi:hypothetical protein
VVPSRHDIFFEGLLVYLVVLINVAQQQQQQQWIGNAAIRGEQNQARAVSVLELSNGKYTAMVVCRVS